ncbi:MAG TPA: PilW family protein [Burkholderiales bacterium]|nr:PilW family protein [Burkholderiales bacterium]
MNRIVTTACARGFGLVEIMVAMVIAMVGMIVIFQVFALSESYNRTAISGSDAQENGAYSLYVLEQEMRAAGWGFNNSRALGCNVLAYNSSLGALNYTLAPVVINAGPGNGSDSLEVNSGNQNLLVAPVAIYQDQVSTTDPFVVANRYGFNVGDLILASEPGKSCTLAQVSQLPTGAQSTTIMRTGAGYPYNNPSGSGVMYTAAGFVFNLGSAPTRDVFSVVNNQLVVLPQLSSTTQQVVADGVVQIKAQYGKDNGVNNGTVPVGPYTANDGVVDSYDNVTPNSAAAWGQVLTVRIGVVTRSAQPEKPSGGGTACNTTTTAPTWSGSTTLSGASLDPFDLTANANWMCYRYKVFETVIPVKNILWTQG